MNQLEFATKLNEAYKGTVQPLNKYLNKHAVISFHCTSCGLKFFNSPKYMVGKDHQRHACNMPYGDSYGGRTKSVSSLNIHKKNKAKNVDGEKLADTLDGFLKEDRSFHEIRTKTGLNLNLIRFYKETLYKPKEVEEEIESLSNLTIFKVSKRGRKAYIGELCQIYIECQTCQEVKHIDSFSIHKNSFLKRHSNCKKCQKEYVKKRKAKG
jgi:hypothetical protein